LLTCSKHTLTSSKTICAPRWRFAADYTQHETVLAAD